MSTSTATGKDPTTVHSNPFPLPSNCLEAKEQCYFNFKKDENERESIVSTSSSSRKIKILLAKSKTTITDKADSSLCRASGSGCDNIDFQTPQKGNAKYDLQSPKLTKKPADIPAGSQYTPETRNKYAHKTQSQESSTEEKSAVIKPVTFGKRKLEYPTEEIKKDQEETEQIYNSKRIRSPCPSRIQVQYIHLKTSDGKSLIFPIYNERDLNFDVAIQETIRKLDMDNDCETETDVLETATKTVLEDLEVALQLQREEDQKGKSDETDAASSVSDSELTSYNSDESDENTESVNESEESSTVQSEICSKHVIPKKNVKFLKNFSQ